MSTTKKNSSKTPAQQPTLPTAAAGESTRVEVVTPALAAEWLKKNTRNRRPLLSKVANLVREIKEGRWVLTHQGIAFGEDGTLFDGQHRLLAVVEAGAPVTMRVTRGLPAETLNAIDTGTSRRSQDVLAIADGVVIGSDLRATICNAYHLSTRGELTGNRQALTVHDLRAAVAEHGPDATAVLGILGQSHGKLNKAAMLAALTIIYRSDPVRCLNFAELYRDGESMSGDHPAMRLRNFILFDYSAAGGTSMDDLALRTFSAFDLYADGRFVKLLKRNESARAKYLAPWRSETSTAT